MGDWVDVLSLLREIIEKILNQRVDDRENFFNSHIEPSYSLMRDIHNDYSQNFINLSNMLAKDNSQDYSEVLGWLKLQQTHLSAHRIEVRHLDTVFTKRQIFQILSSQRSSKQHLVYENSINYTRNISSYFKAGDCFSDYTWYSAFIRKVEKILDDKTLIKLSNRSFGRTESILDLSSIVSRAAEKELPSRFSELSVRYAKLKSVCLS